MFGFSVDAYILGDKLQDGDFKDIIIDVMIEKCKSKTSDKYQWFSVGPVIQCIYDNIPESSKVKRLLINIYVYHESGSWLYD
jgi:hypothetical protein